MLLALLLALRLGQDLARQDDPLTGVWEGRGKGDNPMIPPEGFGFTLVLEARGEDEALATITMEEATSKPAEASFDADSGELSFRCDLMGLLVDVELVVAADELAGKASGLGMTVDLAGKRTSRELPAKTVATGARAPVDLTTLTSADWREDLAFLAENLTKKHANAFHAITREDWEARVKALEQRLPELSSARTAVALAQLVASVGDAHTVLWLNGTPFNAYFPVRFAWLSDGLFVTEVDERFGEALAARVLRIGNSSAADALAAVSTTFAHENEAWPRSQAPGRLAMPALLAALGVIPDSSAIPLGLESAPGSGASSSVSVIVDGSGSGTWLVAPDATLVPTPLWRQRTNETYWFEVLESRKAVYLAYNRCAEDPKRPMAGFMAEVFAALEKAQAERLVIDLRHNGGGNSTVLARFVPDIAAHPRLAAPGSVRVLIGPSTYSSGLRNAQELREGARGRLYGEPTGGKPNSYGEVLRFTLPRSGLAVQYSTKSYRQVDGDPPSLDPDVLVPLSSADYFAGADPVLERALE